MRRRDLSHRAILFIAVFSIGVGAQEPTASRRPPPRNGPWTRDLLIFHSLDGRAFSEGKTFVARAGVPCLVRDASDRLIAVFQWFPENPREAFDKVAAAFSADEGTTWSQPEPIVVHGLPEGAQRPFDPTLVLLEDGRLRLYFTSTTPARRIPGIHSAISKDGLHYEFEPGLRFGVDDNATVDAAVARLDSRWHLFSPVQGSQNEGYHAVSEDGLVFRRVADVAVPVRGSWIGNAIVRNHALWFYGSGGQEGWLARSNDGAEWQLISTALRVGGDPAIVSLKNGKDLLVATSRSVRP